MTFLAATVPCHLFSHLELELDSSFPSTPASSICITSTTGSYRYHSFRFLIQQFGNEESRWFQDQTVYNYPWYYFNKVNLTKLYKSLAYQDLLSETSYRMTLPLLPKYLNKSTALFTALLQNMVTAISHNK
jgi:hypothetical protein